MLEVSEDIRMKIYDSVRRDLQPSIFDVAWRVVVAVVSGGVLSLFFCGQFGIGFSNMAYGWLHFVHANMGTFYCALLCGVIFSLAPVFILRILSSGVLFRVIIRKYQRIPAGCIATAGLVMYGHGVFMTDVVPIALWIGSAVLTFQILGFILDEIMNFINYQGLATEI